jgi:hypothetical protein
VRWSSTDDQYFVFDKTNHYYAPVFWIYVGKDKKYPAFSGSVADFRVNIGQDTFRQGKDFTEANDIFAFDTGVKRIAALPDSDVDTFDGSIDSPSDKKTPVYEDTADPTAIEDPSEYGYGFWMRFLTTYPVRLIPGKIAPWYFVARLTANDPYDDVRMGDRMLAVW